MFCLPKTSPIADVSGVFEPKAHRVDGGDQKREGAYWRTYFGRLAATFFAASGCLLLALVSFHKAFAVDDSARADMAVFGDSLTTGAATHPALIFDSKELWDVFSGLKDVSPHIADLPAAHRFGLEDPLRSPRRLWPAKREFVGGWDWSGRNLLHALSRTYLDTEEYTWGYMLAAGLGQDPARLLIAAEDGARVRSLRRHVDRVLEAQDGALPRKMFTFYTGNDLCGPTMDFVTSSEDFATELKRSLKYLAQNGHVDGSGSDVYVLGYLGILQLLHSEAILAKEISAFGEKTSCRELRQNGFRPKDPTRVSTLPAEAWYFSMLMPPNPAAFCATLFGAAGGEGRSETISALANRIRTYRVKQAEAVASANSYVADHYPEKKLRFHYVPDTAELLFEASDIAGDCFHLSPSGHAKVAEAVLAFLGREAG